jgi:hypothetical protein
MDHRLLPCSREPITTPYLEPDESSPYIPMLFPQNMEEADSWEDHIKIDLKEVRVSKTELYCRL